MENLAEAQGKRQTLCQRATRFSFNRGVASDGGARSRWPLILATGRAHVAPQRRPLMATVNHEIMAFGFARDRLVDCLVQEFIAFRGAQRAAQVSCIILTKTHVKRPGAREADAIA